MRMKYPSISDAAGQILRDVAAEEQIKTAERQVLQGVLQPRVRTDVGRELMKLAAQCRAITENPEVSYDDLRNFVAQVNAGRTS